MVYIQVKKLDNLLNLVGELVIDRDRIMTLAQEIDNPALLANKFPRVVRDVAAAGR